MYHYVNNLVNPANGNALPGYLVYALDDASQIVPIYSDENGTPIQNVSGYENAAISDDDGNFNFYIADGTYGVQFRSVDGAVLKTILNIPMLSGSANFFDNLAGLKAANIDLAQVVYDNAPFIWQMGDFTGEDDEINVVASNNVPLTSGAWVRQNAAKIATTDGTVQADLDARPTSTALAAPTGAGMVGFLQDGAGAVARTLEGRGRDVVTPKDFGAISANSPITANHEAFNATLAAVSAPGNEFFSGSARVERGTYRLTAPIDLPPSFARMNGDEGSVIWGAAGQHTLRADSSAFVNATLTGLHLYGGLDALHAGTPGEIATNKLTDIVATQFTGNGMYFQGGITSCPITRPFLDGSASTSGCGIVSVGGINNDNSIVDANIVGCPGPAVKMLGLTQLLDCRRVRVELGGRAGVAQYELEAPLAVSISGWSEASHEYLLKTIGGATEDMAYTVKFDGLMSIGSTYTGSGGFVASKFDVGSKRIIFGSNFWLNPTQAPARAFVYGVNENLRTENSLIYTRDVMGVQEVTLPQRSFTASPQLTFILCTITRPSAADATTNSQLCTLSVQADLRGYSGAGVGGYGAIKWRVGIGALGNAIQFQDIYLDPDTLDRLTAFGITINLTAVNVTATQVQLQVGITGLNLTLANYFAAGISIRSTAYDPASRFVITFP